MQTLLHVCSCPAGRTLACLSKHLHYAIDKKLFNFWPISSESLHQNQVPSINLLQTNCRHFFLLEIKGELDFFYHDDIDAFPGNHETNQSVNRLTNSFKSTDISICSAKHHQQMSLLVKAWPRHATQSQTKA